MSEQWEEAKGHPFGPTACELLRSDERCSRSHPRPHDVHSCAHFFSSVGKGVQKALARRVQPRAERNKGGARQCAFGYNSPLAARQALLIVGLLVQLQTISKRSVGPRRSEAKSNQGG